MCIRDSYRPSVVVEMGPEESRGSCRSIPAFHITDALDECRDLLIRHGGHAAAAGFTIDTDKLDALRERLQAIAEEELSEVDLRPALEIDLELPLEEVSWATHDLLEMLEPTGMENPQPVLSSPGVEVRNMQAIGGGKHLKLVLRDGRGAAWDAIWFRRGHLLDQMPGHVDVVYTLDANEWNQRKRLQLHVQDLRPAQGPATTP